MGHFYLNGAGRGLKIENAGGQLRRRVEVLNILQEGDNGTSCKDDESVGMKLVVFGELYLKKGGEGSSEVVQRTDPAQTLRVE